MYIYIIIYIYIYIYVCVCILYVYQNGLFLFQLDNCLPNQRCTCSTDKPLYIFQ